MGLFNNLGSLISNLGKWIFNTNPDESTEFGDALDDIVASATGSRMTGAQREAAERNEAFTREREDLAWQRTMSADNTKYQRQVADMRAAGLNPMLAAGGSVSAPAASSSPSGTAVGSAGSFNLGSVLSAVSSMRSVSNAYKLGKEQNRINEELGKESLKIERDKADADIANKNEDTRGKGLSNDFFARMQDVRAESERETLGLTTDKRKEVLQGIEESKSKQHFNEQSAKTEESKRSLYLSRELLNSATAENIVAMRPYLQAELSARTESERQAARVSAVDAAYRQGLINAGAIAAAVRETNASADEKDVSAQVKAVERELKTVSLAIKNGTYSSAVLGDDSAAGKVISSLYQGLSATATAVLGK